MKLSAISTCPDMEKDGVWVGYLNDVEFKIARHASPAYMEYLSKISKEHKGKLRSTEEQVELLMDLTSQCLANVVLIDWKGVQDEDGNETAYTPELGLELMRDPAFHDMRQFILEIAQNADEYRKKDIEGTVKN